jgi:cation transport ATPase
MFDLEQSIADWRQQMLATGIKFPVPLEELEIHLREEIERQMKSGLDEQKAFEISVQQIGQANLLKTEFKKAGGFIGWLGENKSARINRILGALWLAYCSSMLWMLLLVAASISAGFHGPTFSWVESVLSGILVALIGGYIFLRGAIGSILLFRGNTRDRRMICLLALLILTTGCLVQINALKISMFVGANVVFSLISIWFLRPQKKSNSKAY